MRWRSLVLGVVGSIAGLLVMRLYRQWIAPQVKKALETEQGEGFAQKSGQQEPSQQAKGPLDSISIVGKHHKENESATAAVGRILYDWAADEEPGQETKTTLSYLVHWGYGMAQGGVYGLLRPDQEWPDLAGGLLFGAGLWIVGDEILVPGLGLQKGPTAASPAQHLNRLGMHLAYGAGTAAATQALNRLFSKE